MTTSATFKLRNTLPWLLASALALCASLDAAAVDARHQAADPSAWVAMTAAERQNEVILERRRAEQRALERQREAQRQSEQAATQRQADNASATQAATARRLEEESLQNQRVADKAAQQRADEALHAYQKSLLQKQDAERQTRRLNDDKLANQRLLDRKRQDAAAASRAAEARQAPLRAQQKATGLPVDACLDGKPIAQKPGSRPMGLPATGGPCVLPAN